MSQNCIFCCREELNLVAENDLSFAIRDKFPVTPLHTLVLSKRCVATPFELSGDELQAIVRLADDCRRQIIMEDISVAGFNFGANIGVVAGQKIMHVHFHLIPRRGGDIAPPPAIEG